MSTIGKLINYFIMDANVGGKLIIKQEAKKAPDLSAFKTFISLFLFGFTLLFAYLPVKMYYGSLNNVGHDCLGVSNGSGLLIRSLAGFF